MFLEYLTFGVRAGSKMWHFFRYQNFKERIRTSVRVLDALMILLLYGRMVAFLLLNERARRLVLLHVLHNARLPLRVFDFCIGSFRERTCSTSSRCQKHIAFLSLTFTHCLVFYTLFRRSLLITIKLLISFLNEHMLQLPDVPVIISLTQLLSL